MSTAEWFKVIFFLNILVFVNLSKYPAFFDDLDLKQMGLGQNPYNANPSASLSRIKPTIPKRYSHHPAGYKPDPYGFDHPANLPANALPPHRAPINHALRGDPTEEDIVQLVENAQDEKIFPDDDGLPDSEDEMNLDKLPERLTQSKKWGEFRSLIAEEGEKHHGEVMENWEEDAHKWATYSRHLMERAAHEEKMKVARQATATKAPLGHPNVGMDPYWSEDSVHKMASEPANPQWTRRDNMYRDSRDNDYYDGEGPMDNSERFPRMYYRGDQRDFVQNGRVSRGADEQEDYMTPSRGADHMPELDYDNFKKANLLNSPQTSASGSKGLDSIYQGKYSASGSISPQSIYQGSLQQGLSNSQQGSVMNPLSIPGPGSEKDFPNGYQPFAQKNSDQSFDFGRDPAFNGGSYPQAKQLMPRPRAAPDIPMENIPPPPAKAKPQENLKSVLRMGGQMGGDMGGEGFGAKYPMRGAHQHGAGNMPSGGMQGYGPGGVPRNAHGMTPADFFGGGGGMSGGGLPSDGMSDGGMSGGGMAGGGMSGGAMSGGGMAGGGMAGGGMSGDGMAGGGMSGGGMSGGGMSGGGMSGSGISGDAMRGYPLSAMSGGAMNGNPSGGAPIRGPSFPGKRPGPGAEIQYPNGYKPSYSANQNEEGPKGKPSRDMIGFSPDYEGDGEPEYGQLPRNLPKQFHQGLDAPEYIREQSVGVRSKRPVYTGFPTGNKLMNIAKQKLMALNQMDPLNNATALAASTSTEKVLTKEEMINNLRQYDDFKAPIRWVKFNSPDTRDGLARVTDELTHKNQQFIIEGELYVPVIDESMARLGWTTEPPYVTTTAAPVVHQDEAALRVVMRTMDLNATDQRDWLVFETIMGSKSLRERQCDGENCQARCTKLACESLCRGDTCGAGCVGANCNTYCKGPGCSAMCIGDQCTSKCDGLNCESRCWGKGCTADCKKFSCQKTDNGVFHRSNSTWDNMYPQYEMEQNQSGMQQNPSPNYGTNRKEEEYYD